MLLQKFFLKNFRSIGNKGLELDFAKGSTIFIGENNVGKSSIFEAIKMMINLNVMEKIPWDIENWNESNQTKQIDLQLTISLTDDEILKIISFLEPLEMSVNSFKQVFSDQLVYRIVVKTPDNRPESFFILGDLTIHNRVGRLGEFDERYSSYGFDWGDCVIDGIPNSLENCVRSHARKLWQSSINSEQNADTFDISKAGLTFQKDLPQLILELLRLNMIHIEEYREKPAKELTSFLTTPTGRNLASVLFNLKNSRAGKRKFEIIKHEFHEIYPNLELDVIKEGEEIKILTEKKGVDSTTHFLGAGVLQILLLVTHIVAQKNKIILIDHPEVHLHPHAERNLSNLIDESTDTQILLITHSPYFVKIDKSHRILRFAQKNSQTEVYTMAPNQLGDKDYLKLDYLFDVGSMEIFFAKKVLLVEGPTEYGAIPIFSKAQKFPFDKHGVSIIDVDGKSNIGLIARLCEGYHIPYLVLVDGDAKADMDKINLPQKSKRKRITVLPKDFEELLPVELIVEAKKKVGRSKPRVGKYVATEMINQKLEIPSEITKLILKLKELQD